MTAATERADVTAPDVRVGVLGPLRVEAAGRELVVPPGNQRRLLAALLLGRGRVVPLDRILTDVWGEDPPSDVQASLHTTVARLRRALGPLRQLLRTGPGGYLLAVPRAQRDDAEFIRLLAAAREARGEERLDLSAQALALWRGSAWQEYDQDLAVAEARRLEDLRWQALETQAETLVELGRHGEGIAELRALLAERPLRERTVLALVDALDRAGDSDEALEQVERYRSLLSEELGLDPSGEVDRLQERVLRRERSSTGLRRRADDPPAGSFVHSPEQEAPRSELRPLMGRSELMLTVQERLMPGAVVTLVGPGGVGKTAIARHLQAGAASSWWVDLQQVTRPEEVLESVLSATGGREDLGSSGAQTLSRRLAAASGLLVLDNCEHVLDAAATLVQATTRDADHLTVLVTSRRRLGVSAEMVVPVPPLRVEGSGGELSPAVELFQTRATQAAPTLRPDDDVHGMSAAICRRLDGLPLAIELAAAHVGAISLHDLEADLASHLDLLQATGRVGHERHRTMRATMQWSYDLLSPAEQTVFRGLGVFAAGFELAAAQRVLAVLGLSPGQVAVALAELVRRSVVLAPDPIESGQYRLLQTMRVFSGDVSDATEREQLTGAHRDWVLRVAEEAHPHLSGEDEPRWAARLTTMLPDLRAAFTAALQVGDVESAGRLVEALGRWGYLSLSTEILGWADRIVASGQPPSPRVLVTAACSAWLRGDHLASTELAHAAVDGSAGRDPVAAYLGQEILADNALFTGDTAQGQQYYRQALEGARRAGNMADAAMGACGVALAKAYSGHGGHEEAQEALSLAHRSGNPSALAMAFYSDGEVRGDEELEVALESLRRARAVDVGPVKSLSHLVSLTATAALLGRRGPLTPDTFDSVASTVRHWKDHGSTAFLVTCLRNTVPLLVRAGCDREALLLGDALSRIPTEHVSYGAEAEWLQQSLTLAEGRTSTTAAHGSEGWMRLSDAAEEVVQTLRRLARESGAHPR